MPRKMKVNVFFLSPSQEHWMFWKCRKEEIQNFGGLFLGWGVIKCLLCSVNDCCIMTVWHVTYKLCFCCILKTVAEELGWLKAFNCLWTCAAMLTMQKVLFAALWTLKNLAMGLRHSRMQNYLSLYFSVCIIIYNIRKMWPVRAYKITIYIFILVCSASYK